MRTFIVGTRGSKLALLQTEWVISQLKEQNPHLEFKMKIIKTKGDLIVDVALDKIGDKGLFVKEIEQQLLDGEIDFAVHSMKDMPSELPEGLCFARTPMREDARDVLILNKKYKRIEDLPIGATIGTGSKRRKYQLKKYREDLKVVSIRGNIDTRIKKIETEHLDGIILAAAGVHRAGLQSEISYYFSPDMMVPAPAQGALAIEVRQADTDVLNLVAGIADVNSECLVTAERSFLKAVNGSCHFPIGAYAEFENDRLKLTGLYGNESGSCLIVRTLYGDLTQPGELGQTLAKSMLKEYEKHER